MKLLGKKLNALGIENDLIKKIFTRGQRNLNRIIDIQYEVEDLLREKDFKAYHILNKLLDACKDELTILIESETENIDIINRVHRTIENLFGPRKIKSQSLLLDGYLIELIEQLRPKFEHRKCLLNIQIDKNISIYIPPEILDTITRGIIRNAFEYTPDVGKIDIVLKSTENYPELIVRDFGIGFTRKKLHLIFKNYFTPPESIDYSTKKPYDFNAGGRGFDLLRIKIFSEQYHFKIWIDSNRCKVIPTDNDICPSDIHLCRACTTPDNCFMSDGTSIHIKFQSSSATSGQSHVK